MSTEGEKLERFNPLVLYNILDAVRRFEPDFYAHLCRSYHLDADRILGLFSEVETMGGGQLASIVRDLRAHQAYHDIVYLAGRNTWLSWQQQQHLRAPIFTKGQNKLTTLIKQQLPEFLGNASFILMLRGSVQFLEIRDSVFTREVKHDRPLCGFYSGFLAELATFCGLEHATATEVRCCSQDPDAATCLFQIGT